MKIRLIRLGIFLSLSVILITSIISLSPSAQAGPVAQPPATLTPDSSAARLPSEKNDTKNSPPPLVAAEGISPQSCSNLIQDPSFETTDFFYWPDTNNYWDEASTNFDTPLCTVDDCGLGGGTAGPYTGTAWAWFGGIDQTEQGIALQTVTIPTDTASLEFYFWLGTADVGSDANDQFTAWIDSTPVFTATALEASSYLTYTLVTQDVSAFADGAAHDVVFYSITDGQTVNFNVDDVSLCSSVSGGPTNTPTRTNTPGGPTDTPTRTNTPVPPTNTPTPTNTSSGVLVYLPLVMKQYPLPPTPTPTSVPGSWAGTTNLGYAVSFNVSTNGAQWTNFALTTHWSATVCSASVSETLTVSKSGPGTISSGNFSYFSSSYDFTGHFNSATTATGTFAFKSYPRTVSVPYPPYTCTYYLTQSGTWSATKQ